MFSLERISEMKFKSILCAFLDCLGNANLGERQVRVTLKTLEVGFISLELSRYS